MNSEARILITGIGGFIGSHLSKLILKEVRGIFGWSRSTVNQENITLHRVDICQPNQVDESIRTIRPTHIFHLAGHSDRNDLFRSMDVNFSGTEHLISSVLKYCHDARIMIAGSASVYGPGHATGTGFTERDMMNPVNAYGISKSCQELLSRKYLLTDSMDILIVRIFNLTGPGEPSRMACASICNQIKSADIPVDGTLYIHGRLEVARDFVDVRDAARAMLLLMGYRGSHKIFNICSGIPVPIRRVAQLLVNLSGKSIRSILSPDPVDRPGDVLNCHGNPTLIQKEISWRPEYSLDTSLKDMYLHQSAIVSV